MAAPTSLELDILAKFKDRLADFNFDNGRETQMFLMRFLRARNHNLSKSEDMLRKHMEWRKVNKIDALLNWTPPNMLLEEYQFDVAGFDKEGCPILIVPFGAWDVRKVCESGLKQEYVKYVDQLFLQVTEAMKESSARKGIPVTQFICIMIPDEFQAFRQMSSPQAVDTVLETVRRFEANYPEMLKSGFVIDAPKVFNLIFNVIRPLLNSTTLGKVTISSNEKEWRAKLLTLIDENQLCRRLYGTRESRVPILNFERGAYKANRNAVAASENSDGFLAVTIGAGQTFKVEQEVESGCQLRWSFKTENNDIGFSVIPKDSDKEQPQPLVPYARVNSHLEPHEGSVLCTKSGKYTLIFDNTFSRFRSKVLRYKISVDDKQGGQQPAPQKPGKGNVSNNATSSRRTEENAGGSSGNNSDLDSTSL